MKSNLTIQEFLDQKQVMESKIERATSAAMFEFREATGLSPNFVRFNLVCASTIGDPHDVFHVMSVETEVDIRSK